MQSASKPSFIQSLQAAIESQKAQGRTVWKTITVLFKLRVVSLLLLSAVGGAFLGAGGWPGWLNLIILLVTGGASAAGASAFNQYWEREKDKLMVRTQTRPLADGSIERPELVLGIAFLLVALPVLATFPFNPALSGFLALGAFIYIVIYTIWLKPRTLLNIVIGGAAGSAAVLSGGAAVGAWNDPTVLALAAVMFVWTPAHFWSLAIMVKEDYTRASTPMLPSRTSESAAAWWVFAHMVPTALGSVALAVDPRLGWLYFVPVALYAVELFRLNFKLIRTPDKKSASRLFIASNLFLMVVLLMIMASTSLNQAFA